MRTHFYFSLANVFRSPLPRSFLLSPVPCPERNQGGQQGAGAGGVSQGEALYANSLRVQSALQGYGFVVLGVIALS